MRVQVYKNLRNGTWSVRSKGKVIAHLAECILADVTFRVSEKRRQAVIAKRCREVHAWAEGEVVEALPAEYAAVPVTYNPYRCGTFTRRDSGAAVVAAAYVHFTKADGAVAVGAIVEG